MHCEDVIRELATPGDGQDSAALAEHLGACPACAEWSARASSLDRLWAQTRPVDPSAEAWNEVWGRLERALEPQMAENVGSASGGMPHPHTPLKIFSYPETEADVGKPKSLAVQRGTGRSPFLPDGLLIRVLLFCSAACVLVGLTLPTIHKGIEKARIEGAGISIPGGSVEVPFVEIEEGDLVVIHAVDSIDGERAGQVDVTTFEPGNGIDPWYVMFNEVESMAKPLMAAR